MKKFILAIAMVLLLAGCSSGNGSIVSEEPTATTGEKSWQAQFGEAGFTNDEITSCEEVLEKLGLTEIYIMDFTNNGLMDNLRARIFNSENLQLNVTFENHIAIYVELTGVMGKNEAWSNRTDKLALGVGLQGQENVPMYSDTEGGVLAVLNWNDKELSKAEQTPEQEGTADIRKLQSGDTVSIVGQRANSTLANGNTIWVQVRQPDGTFVIYHCQLKDEFLESAEGLKLGAVAKVNGLFLSLAEFEQENTSPLVTLYDCEIVE